MLEVDPLLLPKPAPPPKYADASESSTADSSKKKPLPPGQENVLYPSQDPLMLGTSNRSFI